MLILIGYAVDLEKPLLIMVEAKAKQSGLNNVKTLQRDIEADGTSLPDASMDYVMLFNILHGSQTKKILEEASRISKPKATIGIIHWNYDPTTPRGPPMELRLKPEQIMQMSAELGLKLEKRLDLRPYHYGLRLRKP